MFSPSLVLGCQMQENIKYDSCSALQLRHRHNYVQEAQESEATPQPRQEVLSWYGETCISVKIATEVQEADVDQVLHTAARRKVFHG